MIFEILLNCNGLKAQTLIKLLRILKLYQQCKSLIVHAFFGSEAWQLASEEGPMVKLWFTEGNEVFEV